MTRDLGGRPVIQWRAGGWIRALVGVTATAVLLGTPALAIPSPSDPGTAPVAEAAQQAADRTDRAWPARPPWDACPRPIWPGALSPGSPGGGRRVLVIGDSLTRESRVLTAKGMRRSGWTPTFRCWGSRRLDWAIDQVQRSRTLAQLPRTVIIALGTNDISWETQATTERRVRTLLRLLGPTRTVLWVDLHLTRSAWLDARAEWFNDLIRRLARERDNLTVVGWHRVARAHGIHGWDGIHYGPYGYRLRAATVLRALNAVGRAHPAVRPAPTPLPSPTAVPTPVATSVPPPTTAPTPAP